MRMRLEATTRSPASSSIAVTAPVRLRRVASGLMIENVRVTAMGMSFDVGIGRAPSGEAAGAQGRSMLQCSRKALAGLAPPSALLLPEVSLDSCEPAERDPALARGGDGAFVEQQEHPLEPRFR